MSLTTHLWQSTVCAGVAALLRRAEARLGPERHGIWLFASLKFLVPLSLFVMAGNWMGLLSRLCPRPRCRSRSAGSTNRCRCGARPVDGAGSIGLPLDVDGQWRLAPAIVWASASRC